MPSRRCCANRSICISPGTITGFAASAGGVECRISTKSSTRSASHDDEPSRDVSMRKKKCPRSWRDAARVVVRSEEHTSELQSLRHLVCRLLLVKKKQTRELDPH